jgi:hypothetical protein
LGRSWGRAGRRKGRGSPADARAEISSKEARRKVQATKMV